MQKLGLYYTSQPSRCLHCSLQRAVAKLCWRGCSASSWGPLGSASLMSILLPASGKPLHDQWDFRHFLNLSAAGILVKSRGLITQHGSAVKKELSLKHRPGGMQSCEVCMWFCRSEGWAGQLSTGVALLFESWLGAPAYYKACCSWSVAVFHDTQCSGFSIRRLLVARSPETISVGHIITVVGKRTDHALAEVPCHS